MCTSGAHKTQTRTSHIANTEKCAAGTYKHRKLVDTDTCGACHTKHKHQKIDTNVLDEAHKQFVSNTERPVSTDRRTAPWVARAELNRDYVGISFRIATSMGCIGCAARQSTNSFRPVWQSRQFLPIQCCQAGPRPAGRSRRTQSRCHS